MAHTKAQKAASTNRDSQGKRLGVKIYGEQKVEVGNVIIKQRGESFKAGVGTKVGKDYTIYATRAGRVSFIKKLGKKFVTVKEDLKK